MAPPETEGAVKSCVELSAFAWHSLAWYVNLIRLGTNRLFILYVICGGLFNVSPQHVPHTTQARMSNCYIVAPVCESGLKTCDKSNL